MIKATSAIAGRAERPGAFADERRERDAGSPSFALELAAESRRPHPGPKEAPAHEGQREPGERDEARDGAGVLLAAHDPRPIAARGQPEVDHQVASGSGAPLVDKPLGAQAASAQATGAAPEGMRAGGSPLPQGAEAFMLEAALEADTVSLTAAPASKAALSIESAVALASNGLEAAALLAPATEDEPSELEPDAFGDDGASFELRPAEPAPAGGHRPQHAAPADAQRAIADLIADAVHELGAHSSERTDVVRFRTADVSFSAVVRHDASSSHVKLLSDDPNTRAFLGDRLPEVRQALERVGFASTGLSVAADSSSRHEQRGHAPPTPSDERADEPPTRAPSIAAPDEARDARQPGLHLIL